MTQINVVFPGNERGGAATHIVAFARAVTANQLGSIRFWSLGTGPLEEDMKAICEQLEVVDGPSRQRMARLRQMMERGGQDTLWHAHGPRTNVIMYSANRGVGRVWTSTVQSNPYNDFLGSRLKSTLYTRLNLFCLRRTAGLFVSNQAFADLFADKRTFFVPNAISAVDESMSQSEARNQLLRDIEAPSDAFVIGIVARLDPVKDISTAIRALAMLRGKLARPVHLVVAGDGEERELLAQTAAESGVLDSVHFLGFVKDMVPLYKAFDAHVLPSKSEGVPYVVLEAGVHGVPNIGSDIPGNRSLITDGETGWLFPVGDATALAEQLASVGTHPKLAEERALEFTKRVLPRFSPEAMLEAYLRGYQEMGFTIA